MSHETSTRASAFVVRLRVNQQRLCVRSAGQGTCQLTRARRTGRRQTRN